MPQLWRIVHCRPPGAWHGLLTRAAPARASRLGPPGPPPTVQQMAELLHRQRAYLDSLYIEDHAGEWVFSAEGLAAVLAAATADGSSLTYLHFDASNEVLSSAAAALRGASSLTALELHGRPYGVPLRWAQACSSLHQLRSLSVVADMDDFLPAESLQHLTALTHLKLAPTRGAVLRTLLACPTSLARLELSNAGILWPHNWEGGEAVVPGLPGPVHPGSAVLALLAAGESPELPAAGSVGAALLPCWWRLQCLCIRSCTMDASVFAGEPMARCTIHFHMPECVVSIRFADRRPRHQQPPGRLVCTMYAPNKPLLPPQP
jgi:hypothetical protein